MQSVFVLRDEASIFRVFFSISKFCWFTHFSIGERNSPLSLWMRKNYFFLYQELKFTFAFTREKKLPLSLLWREIRLCLWRRETNIRLFEGVRLTPNSMSERDLPWFGSVCRAWRPRHCGGGSWRHIRPLRPGRTGSWTSLYRRSVHSTGRQPNNVPTVYILTNHVLLLPLKINTPWENLSKNTVFEETVRGLSR